MKTLVLVLASVLLLTACANSNPTTDFLPTAPTGSGTPRPQATSSPTTTNSTPPTGLTLARVIHVVDGDTIDVLIDDKEFRVRYIGVDTPESVDPRRPVECYGREASVRNRQLVEGKTAGLEKDVSETDSFQRLLRYVWLDGQMVNATLVAEGFATAATFPPDVKYVDRFSALEAQARAASLGLWGEACTTPAPVQTASQACEYSGPGQPVIKGNISLSTNEKIYHLPRGEFYDETVVDERRGERWFCTEAEAVAAGWRRSKR